MVNEILAGSDCVLGQEIDTSIAKWRHINSAAVEPQGEAEASQKAWDQAACQQKLNHLLSNSSQVDRARILAASQRESGQWLNAVPVPSLGTLLDPETRRVSLALRLGAAVCVPHRCRCKQMIDARGHHSLSCRFSSGRHPRHAELNDFIKRSLQRAGIPSRLEPIGIDRGDGKRPDGITVFPYKNGRSLC